MQYSRIKISPIVKKGKSKDESLTYPEHMSGLECNSLKPKDFKSVVPKAIIVESMLEGKQVRPLLDMGSSSDFILTTIVD